MAQAAVLCIVSFNWSQAAFRHRRPGPDRRLRQACWLLSAPACPWQLPSVVLVYPSGWGLVVLVYLLAWGMVVLVYLLAWP